MESIDSDSRKRAEEKETSPAEEKTRCVVAPRDGLDKTTIQSIEDDLKKITQAEDIHSFIERSTGILRWWIVHTTPDQLKEIKDHKDVVYAKPSGKMVYARAVHHRSLERTQRSLGNGTKLGSFPMLETRDETQAYNAQLNAVKELRQISIPGDASDLDQWSDFVYEKAAGEGIYIYLIESGVSDHDRAQKELPPSRILDAVQTKLSKKLGERPRGIEERDNHGTCVASKAVGHEYGSAKKAFLVPVKMGDVRNDCLAEGLEAAADDIEAKGRQRKAVVLVSIVSDYAVGADEVDDPTVLFQREFVGRLVGLGVPVVSASGNWATLKGDTGKLRPDIDSMPPIFASLHPMIPVGNVKWDGELHPDSQRGDLLVTNAMGTDITCIGRKGKTMTNTGTSFAAPLVAGYVAVLLSINDETMPFNEPGISNRRFVRRIRDYIRDVACWESPSGNNILRNPITRDSYKKAQEEAKLKESGNDEKDDPGC